MNFESLLTITGNTTKESQNSIEDLRLNQILDAIAHHSKIDKNQLRKTLYERLTDRKDIAHRQNILRDLEKTDVFTAIERFSLGITKVFEFLNKSNKERFKITKQGWFLEAVSEYVSTVERVAIELSEEQLESEGLKNTVEYLKAYRNSQRFERLKEELKTAKSNLDSIQFTVNIKENKVFVNKVDGEKNLNIDIEKLLSRFIEDDLENVELKLTQSPVLTNVEERIVEYVQKINPEPFQYMESFFETHQEFIDKGIRQFYEELDFYLAFLEFIEPLKNEGLSFCFPEIVEKGERIHCKDGFDLALALQLQKDKQRVITNDFYLDRGEKLFLISGPNQGGKTTFARMVGQIFYLALLGLKVPAKESSLFICDHIYTHFEKEEKVENKKGKLEDELLRAKKILNLATERSVIIINEIFSATALEDGYFLAEFLIKKILSKGAFCVFVTFMHRLAELDSSIVPMTSTVEPDNPAVRTFKIVRKSQFEKSYAIYLAQKYCLTYECLKERLKNR